jgi:hypothetical protein
MKVNDYMKTLSLNEIEALQERIKQEVLDKGNELWEKLTAACPEGITNDRAVALLVTLSTMLVHNLHLSSDDVLLIAMMNGRFVHMEMMAALLDEMRAKGIEEA